MSRCRRDVATSVPIRSADAKNVAFDLYAEIRFHNRKSLIFLGITFSSGISPQLNERCFGKMRDYTNRIIEVNTMKGLRDARSDRLLFTDPSESFSWDYRTWKNQRVRRGAAITMPTV